MSEAVVEQVMAFECGCPKSRKFTVRLGLPPQAPGSKEPIPHYLTIMPAPVESTQEV